MKTLAFGTLMGLFGALAVFLSIALAWKGWVLFLAWVSYYLFVFGKSPKKMLMIYIEIVLGIGLSVLIQVVGGFLSSLIGLVGLYLAIFLLIGSLAFLIKIKGLHDLTAWFLGLVVFFGVEPDLTLPAILHLLLLPLGAGFVFGYAIDRITKLTGAYSRPTDS